ncbi:MAG: hypothetical protein PHF86_06595 [Candidatus Nanoarchaeia archaeon]|jgi:hypothetical protein|nr:hypothetical protein [Candidatus Nanoarchaeia archaeon]
MQFFSNFFCFNVVKKLEQQAISSIDLQRNLKAFRLEKDIVIVDVSKNKIIQRVKDTFPSNPVRASFEIIKQLKLATQTEEIKKNLINKRSDVWTCGFRYDEARWVWYCNSQPKMTVGYEEAYKNGAIEDKVYFFSARYGTSIISKIKETSLEKTAKEINAFVLENSYVKVSCTHCENEEHYTIDDLVDQNRKPSYTSNYVVCQHCNELVKLM